MAKILVVFSSIFGANAELAHAAESVLQGLGAQVRTRSVRELLSEGQKTAERNGARVTADDLAWADGFVVSSPSHTGLPSASIKAFIDKHHDMAIAGAYANKTFTAMATSEFAHAGQERVVESLNAAAAVWGCVLVPPSTAYSEINKVNGNPYGLSFVLANGRVADAKATESVLRAHLARFVTITDALASMRMGRHLAHGAETRTPLRAADVFGAGGGGKAPLRAADVFSAAGGGGAPLRAADVFGAGGGGKAPLRAADVFGAAGKGRAPRRAADVFGAAGGGRAPRRAADVFGASGGRKAPLRAADLFSS